IPSCAERNQVSGIRIQGWARNQTRRNQVGGVVKFAGLIVVATLAIGWSISAQQPSTGPAFSPSGELLRPQNYREWIFLTSGLGMTYGPAAEGHSGRPTLFD